MSSDFGPNSGQVEKFISTLAKLEDRHWNEALTAFRSPRASFFPLVVDWLRWRSAWTAVGKVGRLEAKEAALQAVRSLGFDDSKDTKPYDRMTIIGSALFALVVRDAIAAKHFVTLYKPFAKIIDPAIDPPEVV